MKSRIAIALSALALGTAFAIMPSFAQTNDQSKGTAAAQPGSQSGSSGCVRFQTACSDQPYPMPGSAANTSNGGTGNAPQQNAAAARERNSARGNLAYRAAPNRAATTGEAYGFGEQNRYYNAEPGAQFGAEARAGDMQRCETRFRSFDPATGTYTGFDGARHACP
jgi:hypothetical protein